ncbi:threonine--tRNA ligase [Candidatus Uhrbacteria bacterium]|nr:threonine--tRNA ligase [Candidatus Uhrbacteria bacterium]
MSNLDHLQSIRHTLVHLLAASVIELYPGAQNAIGPAIEDGFYQDFYIPVAISDKDLEAIEKKMRGKLKVWQKLKTSEMKTVTVEQARKEFSWNQYKSELINDFSKESKEITFSLTGDFLDLCKGGHAQDLSEIKLDAFKLDRVAGAYWKGDEHNIMLTRIYGLAFFTKEELKAFLARREEAKKRDHRKIAHEQDLLIFSDLVGSGMPLYTPRGNVIRNAIIGYSRELNARLGFGEVHTPNINKAELFKISGHYDLYKADMLSVKSQYVSDEMFLKPMNCPQHTQIYASRPRSYRDLPIRFADFANLYRDEQPGQLSGLTRLRSFAQDDGHIFCRQDQIEEEISNILSAIQEALSTYKIGYRMRFSLRDPDNSAKYLGSDDVWEHSQDIMRKLLQSKGVDFWQAEGEAAFYGPKIDIMAVDALQRQWQISTIQLDFNMPSRFRLTYTASDGTEQTPVMIHRALIGSPDRFLGVLIEHYAGAFPVWMAPVQVAVIPVGEDFIQASQTLAKEFAGARIRCEVRDENESVGYKIRTTAKEKIPYVIVIGEREAPKVGTWKKSSTLSVRVRGKEELLSISLGDFLKHIQQEIQERK